MSALLLEKVHERILLRPLLFNIQNKFTFLRYWPLELKYQNRRTTQKFYVDYHFCPYCVNPFLALKWISYQS